ncbi:MAG: DUF4124 domain-containing protein [Oleiphilaceae bacterium]|nr:DUF4124 domain-containing protein [Oleiphilaceae bacterium]
MTPFSRPLSRLALAALLVGLCAAANAQMYRYIDDKGRPVITNSLPQEVVSRGYEILNSQGRVIEVVPPALTEEQIAEKERERELERQRRAQEEARREADRSLLRKYSSADDAVRALQRSLREMFSLIRLKQGNITNIEGKLAEQENRAANLERQGREVPEQIFDNMERLESQKQDLKKEIATQLEEIETLREDFRERIERMEELTGNPRTLPLSIPEEEDISVSDYRQE